MNIHEGGQRGNYPLPVPLVKEVAVPSEHEVDEEDRTFICSLQLTYLGFSLVDWRCTKAVLNWVIGDRLLFRRPQHEVITLFCHERYFKAEDCEDGELVFQHPISEIYQFTRGRDGLGLAYVTHNSRRDRFYCHSFIASSPEVIATVHDAWSQSKDRVKTNSKTMDLMSLLPAEKQGLLTLTTAFQIEEHSFNVRYLGQMPTTASTGSSGLVDNIVEAALTKQKEQQRRRQQAIKDGRLQQSRRQVLKHRLEAQESSASSSQEPSSPPEDTTDGVISNVVASTSVKMKELQENLTAKKESSDDGLTSPRDSRTPSQGSAKTRFFNLIRRSGSGGSGSTSPAVSPASDFATTAIKQTTEDSGRPQCSSSLTPSSSNEVLATAAKPRTSGMLAAVTSEMISSPDEEHGAESYAVAEDSSKCSSRASNVTGSTLTAVSANSQAVDSGDSGVSGASTPEGDRFLVRATSSSGLSDDSSMSSGKMDTQDFSLNHRMVNLCISAESLRFYDLRRDKEGVTSDYSNSENAEFTKRLCWERKLSSISYCAKGNVHSSSWCLIVSESSSHRAGAKFVCYLFSCSTEEMTVSIMEALTKSFNVAFELHRNPPVVIRSPFCEQCPMYILHQLCIQINSAAQPKFAYAMALKAVEGLPKEDRTWLSDRLQSVQQFSDDVQLQVVLGLLRGVLERLQKDHVHSDSEKPMEIDDTDEATSKPRLGALSRAKRTLANSFEGLRKKEKPTSSPAPSRALKPESPGVPGRRRTIASTSEQEVNGGDKLSYGKRLSNPTVTETGRTSPAWHRSPPSTPPGTPHLAVPLHTPPTLRRRTHGTPTRKTSFRHSIYKTAHATPGGAPLSPSKVDESMEGDDDSEAVTRLSPLLPARQPHPGSSSARGLWKRAIDEQLMLVRLEKELDVDLSSEEMTCRRLAYADVLDSGQREALGGVWNDLFAKAGSDPSNAPKVEVRKAVEEGVPKFQRGQVWKVLCGVRSNSKSKRLDGPVNLSGSLNFTDSQAEQFDDLYKANTSFLHAILIDLGRTFPGHEYFQSISGPGQRSLYKVLRAYANYDEDVGYCQGLSFVAGLIIMHVSSDSDAFHLLRHLMYDFNLRDQYKPDMARLQVHLYQLSRLLHDFYPKLHQLFENHDVAPFFYAAPWFLTLFSTQFPLYFSSRVMDLIFLDGPDAIFKVCLVLLRHAEAQLLDCNSFEQILNCMKNVLPAIAARVPELIMKEALQLDIQDRLRTFEVEHSVLQDLDSTQTMSGDLEAANAALKTQHTELIQQLAVARGNALRLQDTVNELTADNQQLREDVQRYATQTDNLRQTIIRLQEQLECSEASKGEHTGGTDETDGPGATQPAVAPFIRYKKKRNTGLRRRLSVPAFPVERKLVQQRQQLSAEDLAESRLSNLEDFMYQQS